MIIGGVVAVSDDVLMLMFPIWLIALLYFKKNIIKMKSFNVVAVSMIPDNCITMLKYQHSAAHFKAMRMRIYALLRGL